MKKPKQIILDNGVKLVVVPLETTTTTVMVMAEAGAHYEDEQNNGISHLLEHMCFQGTERRPDPLQINRELDLLGFANAYTSYDLTGYHMTVRNKDVSKALDVLSDLYQNSTCDPVLLEKEKRVVIEEINMYNDQPDAIAARNWRTAMYGKSPAGRDIAGTHKTVEGISRESLLAYRDRLYVGGATTVTIAGKITVKDAVTLTKKYFSNVPAGDPVKQRSIIEKTSKQVVLKSRPESDQTHLILGLPAYKVGDDRGYALNLLSGILGQGMSSRLFTKVREELGAAYYIGSGVSEQQKYGQLTIGAGLDTARVYEVLRIILNECYDIAQNGVTDQEYGDAQKQVAKGIDLSLQTSASWAKFYSIDGFYNLPFENPAELIRRHRKVEKDDIQKIARSLFKKDKWRLSVVGPQRRKQAFEQLLLE